MPGFGDFARTADEIEREISRRGVALGIDWSDQQRLHALARQALSCPRGSMGRMVRSPIRTEKLTGELFALAELMFQNMRKSAEVGQVTHGGTAWKAFGLALYEEYEAGVRPPDGDASP